MTRAHDSEGAMCRRISHKALIWMMDARYNLTLWQLREIRKERSHMLHHLGDDGHYCESLSRITTIAGMCPNQRHLNPYRNGNQKNLRDRTVQYPFMIDGVAPMYHCAI
jgi:hypothetical protein